MKASRGYLERKRLEKMRQATKKSVSGKRDAAPALNRPPSAGKPQGICYDFQAGMCTRGKDCRYKHEKSDKGKGGGKKGTSRSLSPGSSNQVCKFWMAVNVLFSIRRNLQLHPQRMTSVRARRRRRRATAPGRQAEVPIPRRALRVSRTKGENYLPLAQLQFA